MTSAGPNLAPPARTSGAFGRVLAGIRGPGSTRSDAALTLDLLSVALFSILWSTALLQWLAGGVPAIALGLLALPLGIAIADFTTGTVHWFADTFFDEHTPVLGPALIYAFREHHRDPLAMERHGFFEVSGNNALACCAPLAVAVWLGPGPALAGIGLHALLLWLTLAVAATNQLHKWAHSRRVPAPVGWLQRRGLVLSRKAHARHHGGGHRNAYCVTVGWLNPSLDRAQLFARCEARIRRLQRRSERPVREGRRP